MTLFAQDSQTLKDFTCKKFKSSIDSNDHLTVSFDLYFKGKKAATYNLDPWSGESHIAYTDTATKSAIDNYAKTNMLYEAIYKDRLESIKQIIELDNITKSEAKEELEKRMQDKVFDTDDVVNEISYAFQKAHEQKKYQSKIKRLCKNSLVVGNDNEYIPLTFKNVKSLEDVLKYRNGRDVLAKSFSRAKEIISENKGANYRFLNEQSQLDALNLT
jgi:hypothetical protein